MQQCGYPLRCRPVVQCGVPRAAAQQIDRRRLGDWLAQVHPRARNFIATLRASPSSDLIQSFSHPKLEFNIQRRHCSESSPDPQLVVEIRFIIRAAPRSSSPHSALNSKPAVSGGQLGVRKACFTPFVRTGCCPAVQCRGASPADDGLHLLLLF